MSVPIYWRESKYRYKLIGSECMKCHKRFYPPKRVCPVCGSRELKDVKLPDKGRVVTYTIIRVPPKGYEEYAPYPIALIELEDGTRLIAQLTDVDPKDVKIGMVVKATFRKLSEIGRDGIIQYGVKFRPLIENES